MRRHFSSLRLATLALLLLAAVLPWLPAAEDAAPGLVATCKGHGEAVYAVAFTPDGKHLVTGSGDRSVRVWDAATGKELKSFAGAAGHQNLVLGVAVSPDGGLIASGGADNTAKLWDFPSSEPLRAVAKSDGTSALAVSPDGTKLAGGDRDGRVKIWNAADGKELFALAGHGGAVTALSFSGNGQLLASCGRDGTLRLWNPTNGQPVAALGAHADAVRGAAFSPGGNALYSIGGDGLLRFWALPPVADKPLGAAHAGEVAALALSADGAQVVSADAAGKVRLTSAASGQLVREFAGAAGAVTDIALSPNGALVAAATADGHLLVWQTKDGKLLANVAAPVTGLAFNAASNQLLTGDRGGAVKRWAMPPAAQPKPAASFDAHAGGVSAVAFHAGGTQAASAGADKTVKLWDVTKGQLLRTFGPLPEAPRAVAFNRAGSQLAAVAGKTAWVWTAADGKEVRKLEHPAALAGVSFSADGARLATAAADGRARVWELSTGNLLQAFLRAGAVRAVACHPTNNAVLVAGGADKTVTQHTATVARVLPAGSPPGAVAVTTNGSHVLTAGEDGKVRYWNAGTGAVERTVEAGGKALQALAVSKNGVLLAAGGADQTVRVFTAADGKLLAQIKAPGAVRSLAFAPTNQALAAACPPPAGPAAAGVLQTWNVVYNPGQPVPADFGKPMQTYHAAGTVGDVVFAGAVFFSGSAEGAVQAWKFAADTPVKNFAHPDLVLAVAFNRDGTQLATGCHDGRVRVFDVAKGTPVRDIQAHVTPPQPPAAVYCLAWTADGKQLVSGSFDHSLKLWNAADGKLVREFKGYEDKKFEKGHRDGVLALALSPDGKTLASAGGWDRSIKLWNVADGSVQRELVNPQIKAGPVPQPPQAHPGVAYALRWTPDGKRLVSAGAAPRRRGYLAVWDAADGKLLSGAEQPLGTLFCLAVSPDGKYLAAGSEGGEEGEGNGVYVMKLPAK